MCDSGSELKYVEEKDWSEWQQWMIMSEDSREYYYYPTNALNIQIICL